MRNLQGIAGILVNLMNITVIVIITISIIAFMYGLLKYIISESPDKKENARKYIINGIIILTIMVSIRGILEILRYTFQGQIGGSYFWSYPTTETINDLKITQ